VLARFVYHVAWRWSRLDGGPAYKGEVQIRGGADGKIWHQAQGTMAGGFLFGATRVGVSALAVAPRNESSGRSGRQV